MVIACILITSVTSCSYRAGQLAPVLTPEQVAEYRLAPLEDKPSVSCSVAWVSCLGAGIGPLERSRTPGAMDLADAVERVFPESGLFSSIGFGEADATYYVNIQCVQHVNFFLNALTLAPAIWSLTIIPGYNWWTYDMAVTVSKSGVRVADYQYHNRARLITHITLLPGVFSQSKTKTHQQAIDNMLWRFIHDFAVSDEYKAR
jgi:hypothetical protein